MSEMSVQMAMDLSNLTVAQVAEPRMLFACKTLAAEVRRLQKVLAAYQIEATRERGNG